MNIRIIISGAILSLLLASCSKSIEENNNVNNVNDKKNEMNGKNEKDEKNDDDVKGWLGEKHVFDYSAFIDNGILLQENLPDAYPTQVFRKSAYADKNIFEELKPDDIKPYMFGMYIRQPVPACMVKVAEPLRGIISYSEAFGEASGSEEWQKALKEYAEIKQGSPWYLSYAVFSAADEGRNFLGDPSLYYLLDGTEGYKYIFMAKIFAVSLTVDLLQDSGPLTKQDIDDACYVSSVIWGRYAYVCLPTNAHPKDVIDFFGNGVLMGDESYKDKYREIFPSPNFNLIEKGYASDGERTAIWSLNDMIRVFHTPKKGDFNIGLPIFFKLRSVKNGETVKPKYNLVTPVKPDMSFPLPGKNGEWNW